MLQGVMEEALILTHGWSPAWMRRFKAPADRVGLLSLPSTR